MRRTINDYVCPKCFNRIENCICEVQPWNLIMVDVNMQEIVRTLNGKGYKTTSCCESHFGDTLNLYISFVCDYGITTPDGFNWKNRDNCIIYSFKKADVSSEEKYNNLKSEKLETLRKLAESLPSIKR